MPLEVRNITERGEAQMKYKILILTLLNILFLTYSAEAATKLFDVQFVVDPRTELTHQVSSYGTRELRALRDVNPVGADPVALKLADGRPWAVVVSYVIQKDDLIEHCVLTGPPDQLEFLVKEVIARFDTNWLEPKRHK
jgi:hypothetical protein